MNMNTMKKYKTAIWIGLFQINLLPLVPHMINL